MISDKHYNREIFNKLQVLVTSRDVEGLFVYLTSLSNAEFRTAGYLLGERILFDADKETFWIFFDKLVTWNSKAFLVTLLKSLSQRLDADLSLYDDGFQEFCRAIAPNPIDVQKTLLRLIPIQHEVAQIKHLFRLLGVDQPSDWIPYLLKNSNMPCSFLLFNSLRYVEHDRPYLIRLTNFLIKKGDGLSFNLASLVKSYFGLTEVKGTFSLNLKPYELARIELSYEAFCDAMKF